MVSPVTEPPDVIRQASVVFWIHSVRQEPSSCPLQCCYTVDQEPCPFQDNLALPSLYLRKGSLDFCTCSPAQPCQVKSETWWPNLSSCCLSLHRFQFFQSTSISSPSPECPNSPYKTTIPLDDDSRFLWSLGPSYGFPTLFCTH